MARIALKTEKVGSHDVDDFTETVDFTILHCANITGNNNKFYSIEIQKNPDDDTYRLFSHYGRLGTTNAYDIRQVDKNGDSLDEERCRIEYDKIIKKKQKGKNVKRGDETIREYYSVVDVVSPTVGSSNIRNASEVSVSNGAPAINTSNHDSESGRLIKAIIKENIHNITNNTTMTFTSNGFETPLGPVTEPHLDKAVDALDAIRDEMGDLAELNENDEEIREINGEYYSLIPREFGHVIDPSEMILTPDKLANEYALVDNLRTAVQAGLNSSDDSKDSAIDIDMSHLSRKDSEWERLSTKFEDTKHRNHSAIKGYHVKNIFTLGIPSVDDRYNPIAKKLGNVHELFHGTKTANMLSISLNGLIIPPTGAAHVTGRMFGNGVYAASCSTKALNYAVGYWGGNANRSNKAYVLIVNFAMGKEYVATSHLYGGAPSGYDSIWAKSGASLLNDEFIIYNLNQATITHILELEK